MRSRAAAAVLLAAATMFVLPAATAAHSELVTSSPADGTTLTAPPAEVLGDFSEAIDPAKSWLELRTSGGVVLAKGGVPAAGPATRMAIAGLSPLEPGSYEVRWTTVTADDGGVERGVFTFAVVREAPPVAPASVAPAASPESPSATPPAGTPTPGPGPTPSPAPAPGAGAGDLLLPVVALAVVLVVGVGWLLRRRR